MTCKYHVVCDFERILLSFIDCELGDLKDVTDDLKEDKNTQADTLKQASGQNKVNSQLIPFQKY